MAIFCLIVLFVTLLISCLSDIYEFQVNITEESVADIWYGWGAVGGNQSPWNFLGRSVGVYNLTLSTQDTISGGDYQFYMGRYSVGYSDSVTIGYIKYLDSDDIHTRDGFSWSCSASVGGCCILVLTITGNQYSNNVIATYGNCNDAYAFESNRATMTPTHLPTIIPSVLPSNVYISTADHDLETVNPDAETTQVHCHNHEPTHCHCSINSSNDGVIAVLVIIILIMTLYAFYQYYRNQRNHDEHGNVRRDDVNHDHRIRRIIPQNSNGAMYEDEDDISHDHIDIDGSDNGSPPRNLNLNIRKLDGNNAISIDDENNAINNEAERNDYKLESVDKEEHDDIDNVNNDGDISQGSGGNDVSMRNNEYENKSNVNDDIHADENEMKDANTDGDNIIVIYDENDGDEFNNDVCNQKQNGEILSEIENDSEVEKMYDKAHVIATETDKEGMVPRGSVLAIGDTGTADSDGNAHIE